MDIEPRLTLCQEDNPTTNCIAPELASACVEMFEQLIAKLETHRVKVKCALNETDLGLSLSEIIADFEGQWQDDVPVHELMTHIVHVIESTPQLGLSVARRDNQLFLLHDHPHVDWTCW